MHIETAPRPPHDRPDALSAVLDEARAAGIALAAAEARRTRALAAAGHLALTVMAGQRASSRAAELALREVASEIAAAEHLSDRTLQIQIGRAMTLADDYPRTLTAWEAGFLTRAHVTAITDTGAPLPAHARAEFDTLATATATAEGLSPGRLRSRLAVLAERLQPTTLTERHHRGRDTRCVRVLPGQDGMSDLVATLPTVLAVAIHDRLTQQARTITDTRRDSDHSRADTHGNSEHSRVDTPGDRDHSRVGTHGQTVTPPAPETSSLSESPPAPDQRTTDHLRADLLADLLLTGTPTADPTRTGDGPGTLGAIRARIQLVVPALTLLTPGRENSDPADLVGHGPIDTATATALTQATTLPWERVITHPITGAVLHTDTYHRTTAIDRHLRARDRHCRWPGCTTPAIRCDLDHTHDHAHGGETTTTNLAHLCRRHHTQKHLTRWTVKQLPAGVLHWTSPTGHTYTDHPHPYTPAVQFLSDGQDHPPDPGQEPPPF